MYRGQLEASIGAYERCNDCDNADFVGERHAHNTGDMCTNPVGDDYFCTCEQGYEDRAHVCKPGGWGHPIPPEDPARLEGPEIGAIMRYRYKGHDPARRQPDENFRDRDDSWWWDIAVKVLHRSYVWSPGECSSRGGFRNYQWTVIQYGPRDSQTMVVNDEDLFPITPGDKVTAK